MDALTNPPTGVTDILGGAEPLSSRQKAEKK